MTRTQLADQQTSQAESQRQLRSDIGELYEDARREQRPGTGGSGFKPEVSALTPGLPVQASGTSWPDRARQSSRTGLPSSMPSPSRVRSGTGLLGVQDC